MIILGSNNSKIAKDKNGENVPYLKFTEVVLVHCNIFNNDYQQDSGVLYTFIPNKLFGQLLDILSKNFMFLKTFNFEFSYTEMAKRLNCERLWVFFLLLKIWVKILVQI